MDQLITFSGKEGHAVLIDCRSLETESIPLNSPDHVFLVTNSNVKHELASSEYAIRKQACDQVSSLLGKSSLRDLSMRELESSANVLTPELYRVARHVVTEIERTTDAKEALKRKELDVFGTLMTQSHVSLRDDYKVSCPEIDELVEAALECEGVLGSRITGGGFGGCTVTLVSKDKVDELKALIVKKYRGKPSFYVFQPAEGGKILKL